MYGVVLVPPAVERELAVEVAGVGSIVTAKCDFLESRAPADAALVARLTERVDIGEAEAIALAMETGADALMIDERAGRRLAAEMGLRTIGVLGILLEAKLGGRVNSIRDMLDTIESRIGFRVHSKLRREVLRLAGEE